MEQLITNKCSVTRILFILSAALWGKVILHMHRRKLVQARFETRPRCNSHLRTAQNANSGSLAPVLWGFLVIQSWPHEKGHMIKFIKQFKKALYKSSRNTLQGLGAYDKHFLTIALHLSQLYYFVLIINTFVLFKKKSFCRKMADFSTGTVYALKLNLVTTYSD